MASVQPETLGTPGGIETGAAPCAQQHIIVVAFFTVLSVARGYAIRRWFNNGMHLVAVKLARKAWAIFYA